MGLRLVVVDEGAESKRLGCWRTRGINTTSSRLGTPGAQQTANPCLEPSTESSSTRPSRTGQLHRRVTSAAPNSRQLEHPPQLRGREINSAIRPGEVLLGFPGSLRSAPAGVHVQAGHPLRRDPSRSSTPRQRGWPTAKFSSP